MHPARGRLREPGWLLLCPALMCTLRKGGCKSQAMLCTATRMTTGRPHALQHQFAAAMRMITGRSHAFQHQRFAVLLAES